jgi:sulfonate transport system substrate-binding protein
VTEQTTALQSKQVDAVATWDPTLEKLTRLGFRLVHESKQGDSPAWLGLTGRWLERNGEERTIALLKAWITAVWWTSNNLEQARTWFSNTSRIDKAILASASKADRYLKTPVADITALDFTIGADQLAASQRVVDFLVERKLLQQTIAVPSFIDNNPVRRAQEEIAQGKRVDAKDIKVRTA